MKYFSKTNKIFKAFTLAEVLITLGIIGVVAAMTIPALITNYQKEQTVVQLKKIYSELYNAVKLSELDNSNISSWTFGTKAFDAAEVTTFAETYITPYLKIMKNCKSLTGASNTCTEFNRKKLRDNEANNIYVMPKTNPNNYKFVLGNGSLLWINTYINRTNIFVDLNGDKGPNITSKDIFAFYITPTDKNIKLWGEGNSRITLLDNSDSGCNKTVADNLSGGFCGALIKYDGWQIKEDYPWD